MFSFNVLTLANQPRGTCYQASGMGGYLVVLHKYAQATQLGQVRAEAGDTLIALQPKPAGRLAFMFLIHPADQSDPLSEDTVKGPFYGSVKPILADGDGAGSLSRSGSSQLLLTAELMQFLLSSSSWTATTVAAAEKNRSSDGEW